MQAAALERRGFDKVYRADELADFIKSARPGAVLGIPSLEVLANPKIKPPAKRRREFWRIIRSLPPDCVLEDAKGRRTDRDVLAMIEDAIEAITQKRRADAARKNGAKSRGRPVKILAEDRAKAKPIWFSREHVTAEDAVAAMPLYRDKDGVLQRWTVSDAYHYFKARG